jgi:hypothetical protein
LTSSFGIDGNFATTRSSFLALLGIRRLLGVRYAPHTELRTGSEKPTLPSLSRTWSSRADAIPAPIHLQFPDSPDYPCRNHQNRVFQRLPQLDHLRRPIIKSGDPVEQEKHLKYATLVANSIMLSNVSDLTKVLSSMSNDGHPVTAELAAATSPYMRTNIRRFGKYGLDMEEMPAPLFPKPLPFKMPL